MSVEEDIQDELVSVSIIGGSTGWLPVSPKFDDQQNKEVAFTPQPGRSPDAFGASEMPRVQIRVRGGPNETREARTKIRDIYHYLHQLEPGSINGIEYGGMWAAGSPAFIRTDETGRDEYGINIQIIKART